MTDIEIRDNFVDFVFQSPNTSAKRTPCRREDIEPSVTDTIGPPYILDFGDRCAQQLLFWDFDQARRLADALYMIRERGLNLIGVEERKMAPSLPGIPGMGADR